MERLSKRCSVVRRMVAVHRRVAGIPTGLCVCSSRSSELKIITQVRDDASNPRQRAAPALPPLLPGVCWATFPASTYTLMNWRQEVLRRVSNGVLRMLFSDERSKSVTDKHDHRFEISGCCFEVF
ncbi:hypothetical protein EVAR_22924_1 [Eumeta japonica]|uniref:Uncharacterized protein n=1 Tax=Eumeta variegata TaxID=151549 RepID=A0A4C1UVK5_EUMVA|nr:hypothetical protein EVAR_22924_1 [Eumeta japonica]